MYLRRAVAPYCSKQDEASAIMASSYPQVFKLSSCIDFNLNVPASAVDQRCQSWLWFTSEKRVMFLHCGVGDSGT